MIDYICMKIIHHNKSIAKNNWPFKTLEWKSSFQPTIMGWRYLESLHIHNLHLMKSQRPSGGFCYNSFMVFGALDHFEKLDPQIPY